MFTLKNIFWSIVFVLGVGLFWLLLLAPIETYYGIDMPWVEINRNNFNIFGYKVADDARPGVLLACGLLMMFPARIIHLAILKLGQRTY